MMTVVKHFYEYEFGKSERADLSYLSKLLDDPSKFLVRPRSYSIECRPGGVGSSPSIYAELCQEFFEYVIIFCIISPYYKKMEIKYFHVNKLAFWSPIWKCWKKLSRVLKESKDVCCL